MFVYVEYESNLRTTVVEHTQVQSLYSAGRSFDPIGPDDFDPSETYRVHSCNGTNSVCEYLNAKIIYMTDTLEEMAAFRAQRPRRPIIRVQNGPARREETASRSPVQQDESHARSVQRQRLIEDALHEYELSYVPARFHTASQNGLPPMEQEQLDGVRQYNDQGESLLTTSRAGEVVPRNFYTVLKEKHDTLVRDMKELRSWNGDLQKILKCNIFKAEGRLIYATSSDVAVTTVPATTSAAQEANAQPAQDETSTAGQPEATDDISCEEADDDTPKIGSVGPNGKVYAGNDFWFAKPVWDELFNSPTDSTFCYRAANLLWKPEELITRSVTGKISNRFVARGMTKPRPPLTPKKLYTLKAMFRLYIGKDPLAASRMKNVRKYLSAKLADMRRRPVY